MRRLWRRRTRGRDATHLSILDLGASTVKASVIERAEDGVRILGRARVFHPGGIAPDGTIRSLGLLASACEQAVTQAEDNTESVCPGKVVPDAVLMAVPLAWLRGTVGFGHVRRPNLEEGIVAEECAEQAVRSGQVATDRLAQIMPGGQWQLLDATVVAFSVDGHRVTDPVGFRGHVLEAQSFAVAAPRRLLDALREIADALQLDPPHLVAEPLALAGAAPGDGLVIQVGAQTTGLIWARHGAPLGFASVPQGGYSLVRAVADAFDISASRADAVLRGYGAGRLNDEGQRALERVLEEPLDVWLSMLVERLRSWDWPSLDRPVDIYLCGGAAALGSLQTLVSSVRWLDTLSFPRMPRVRVWDGSNLTQVTDLTGSKWQLSDVTGLSVAAWTLRDRGPSSADGIVCSALKIPCSQWA